MGYYALIALRTSYAAIKQMHESSEPEQKRDRRQSDRTVRFTIKDRGYTFAAE